MKKLLSIFVFFLVLGFSVNVYSQEEAVDNSDSANLEAAQKIAQENVTEKTLANEESKLQNSLQSEPQNEEALLPVETANTVAQPEELNIPTQKATESKALEAKQETASSAPAAIAKQITGLEISGNKSISTNTIVSKMKTKVGMVYQENVLNEDLKRLYLLGYFSDVKIDTQDYKDGLKIVVVVVERPIVESISFTGMRYVNAQGDKLKKTLKSKEGQYLDYPNLAEDVRAIKKMYDKIGFSQAEIKYNLDLNKETNRAKVTFVAVEGKKVRIKNITFTGNKAYSSRRLQRLIKTKPAWFVFTPGVLKDEVIKEDIERLKGFYGKNGFADVQVDYEVKSDPKKPFLYITFTINEGKKYLVGSLVIQGNKDISEKDILGKVKDSLPNKVFSQEAVKQDISNIQGLYFDRGYISAQVQEATAVDVASGKVNVVYNITENNINYVDKIKIRGNVKTKDVVIRRELRIRPGDKFDGEKLRRSKERLQNLGFFEDVSYDTEDTAAPDKKDLIVDVKESKTGSFSFGGGYSTVDQFVGFVEIEQQNFDWKNWPYFTGAGQNLRFRASLGNLSDGFELSFTDPWIYDYPVSFGFDAYRRSHKRDSSVGYGYDEVTTGGDVRLGKEFTDFVKADTSYRYESIDISNIADNASQDLMDEVGTNKVSSLSFGATFDNRDNVFAPLRGNYLNASTTIAGGPLSGDKDFWKFFGTASHYFPMPFNSVIEVKGRVAVADKYDDTKKVPIYERYFAGGADTIRGYHERKVGPYDTNSKDPLGGNSMLIGNIEYTVPVISFIKVAGFFDIGNVWEKVGQIGQKKDTYNNTGSFKKGVGFGIRIKTPLGPVKLDYGIPLDKEPADTDRGSGKVHFSMSRSF